MMKINKNCPKKTASYYNENSLFGENKQMMKQKKSFCPKENTQQIITMKTLHLAKINK